MDKAGAIRDVIVLGGGPAGCAAAIQCAQRGLKVALLEAKAFPRHCPGETLHPGVEPVLRQLGLFERVLTANFPRHEGNWIEWGKQPLRFEPFGSDAEGPWRGFQAWRATFDALLLDRAREVGVEIHQPCATREIIREDGRVAGVMTSAGPLAAKWTLDAAGSRHWLARQLALRVKKFSPRLTARYGYARGRCPARDDAPLISADATGWTWTARIQPELYQWTRLDFARTARPAGWLPAELQGLVPEGPTRAADVTWRKVEPVVGPGFFLVGDAAATLDPASSHGVLKGLMSGMMAAHFVESAGGGGQPEARAMLAYQEWLTGWFDADVAKLRALYSLLSPARFEGA
ncbi:MAG TPA: FAD-dependent oxidoreductase [Chthoniobacterales bacterium]|nr:FAD-dependent oxidoreductase [Chthoniobacterales bacterium]